MESLQTHIYVMATAPDGLAELPYTQKVGDDADGNFTHTVKSYNNRAFLQSRQGRLIRILCEFEEPAGRLRRHKVRSTVLVFGSARSMSAAEHARTVRKHEELLAAAESDTKRAKCEAELRRLRSTQWMCEWVEKVEELAARVAEFATAEREMIAASFTHVPDRLRPTEDDNSAEPRGDNFRDLVVTTGGGPGFMEAANRGAASVAGADTMGMGISLPFEKGLNPYVTEDLAFEFHYFFTRKFWMTYLCRAIIVAPGGFGTMDEMFELLTLRQTRKISSIPIVLFCSKFWKTVVNWEALVEFGTISIEEIDSLCFADTVDDAIDFIKQFFVSTSRQA